MKKIIAIILGAVMACMMFAGCDLPEEQILEVYTQPEQTVATETTEAPVVEVTQPVPTESVTSEEWVTGDEVWFIEHDEYGDGWPYPGMVVEVGAEYLIISRGWDAEGELIVAALADCYRTFEEARVVTGKAVVGEGCC